MPTYYHVWGAMLECYQRYTPKLTNVAELNWLICCKSSLILRQCYHFATLFVWCCSWWTFWTHCWNTEWAIGNWQSSLKHLNRSLKAVQSLNYYTYRQSHVYLKNWTLKFKLLYLLNRISCLNKISMLCCLNTHVHSLKVWPKYVLQSLKYKIYSRWLFLLVYPVQLRFLKYVHSIKDDVAVISFTDVIVW